MLLKRLYKILGKEYADDLISMVFNVLGASGVESIIADLKKELVMGLRKDGVVPKDPNVLKIEIECEENLNDIMSRIMALNDLIKLEHVFISHEKEIFKDA